MTNRNGLSLGGMMLAALAVAGFSAGASAAEQDVALIIGNSDYHGPPDCPKACVGGDDPGAACTDNSQCTGTDPVPDGTCEEIDLPSVALDVLAKQNALENAGWLAVVAENLTKQQMIDAITNSKPASTKKYIVWYSGHGASGTGNPVGVDCEELTPADLTNKLGENASHTLVILDSCYGEAYSNAVNAIDDRVGFITAASADQCSAGIPGAGGLFTQCFVEGLNGAADTNGDNEVTVAEAWAYADANCHFAGEGPPPWAQDPTSDKDYATWVIGKLKVVPTVSEWGLFAMAALLVLAGASIVVRRRTATANS